MNLSNEKKCFWKNNTEQKKKVEKPKIVPKQLDNSKISIFTSKEIKEEKQKKLNEKEEIIPKKFNIKEKEKKWKEDRNLKEKNNSINEEIIHSSNFKGILANYNSSSKKVENNNKKEEKRTLKKLDAENHLKIMNENNNIKYNIIIFQKKQKKYKNLILMTKLIKWKKRNYQIRQKKKNQNLLLKKYIMTILLKKL